MASVSVGPECPPCPTVCPPARDIREPAIFWTVFVFPGLFAISLILLCVYIRRFVIMAKDGYYTWTATRTIELMVLMLAAVGLLLVGPLNLILAAIMAAMVERDWKKYNAAHRLPPPGGD